MTIKKAIFAFLGFLATQAHTVPTLVCIQNDTMATREQLKCMYHYDYNATDRYRCYIRFGGLGSTIQLVDANAPGLQPVPTKPGFNALPAAGLYKFEDRPQYKKKYLYFTSPGTQPGEINIKTLVETGHSVADLARALQVQPQIYRSPTASDLDDIIQIYLSTPLADCVGVIP